MLLNGVAGSKSSCLSEESLVTDDEIVVREKDIEIRSLEFLRTDVAALIGGAIVGNDFHIRRPVAEFTTPVVQNGLDQGDGGFRIALSERCQTFGPTMRCGPQFCLNSIRCAKRAMV